MNTELIIALIGVGGIIVGAIITGGFAIYQTRRNTQLEREKLENQHQHEIDILRLQRELEDQYKKKEHERSQIEKEEETARLMMQHAQTVVERAQAYRQILHADPRIAQLQILDMTRPLNVSDVFVQVKLHSETTTAFGYDQKFLEAGARRDPRYLIIKGREDLELLSSLAQDPVLAIRKYPRCVIVGDPGAGKSTLLKYLTLKSADGQLYKVPDLPIHIELNDFVNSRQTDLLEYASKRWDERYGFPKEEARVYMEEKLLEGNALLLLDALDETAIGGTEEDAEISYQRVSNLITRVATRYNKSAIIVTARKAGYHQRARLYGFVELEILDFRQEEIHKFVSNWFKSYHNFQKQTSAEELNSRLDRNLRLQSLAANPLLLSLIVMVYEAQLDLPERRAELYKQCVETLLTKWDASRNIRRRREFKPEHKRQLLEEVAWHFHNQGKRYFPERELLNLIAAFLPAIGLPERENKRILEEIAEENGLLKEQARELYGFMHLTLQEYFAALHVADRNQLETLLTHYHDPWWEEVITLYAGHTYDASLLLEKLFEMNNPKALILAGHCLAVRPIVRDINLREKIIKALFSLLKNEGEWADTLADIGGLEINRGLLKQLSDRNISVETREDIVAAIGKYGEPSLAPELVKCLSNPHFEKRLKWSIATTLGTLGNRSVANEMLQVLSQSLGNRDLSMRIAAALGILGESSVVSGLQNLLANKQIDPDISNYIFYAIQTLTQDHAQRASV